MKVLPKAIKKKLKLGLSLDDQVVTGNVDLLFSPHGTKFKKPAILNIEAKNLDMSEMNLEAIAVYYDNPKTGKWKKMKSKEIIIKPEDGYIKIIDAELPHFSRYAVAYSD